MPGERRAEGQRSPGSCLDDRLYFCIFFCICLSDAEQSEWRLALPLSPSPGSAEAEARISSGCLAGTQRRPGRPPCAAASGSGGDSAEPSEVGGGRVRAQLPRAWRGLRGSHVGAALCAVSLRRRGMGAGQAATPPRLGWGHRGRRAGPALRQAPATGGVSARLAAVFPLRRCWPGWGWPASGASRTCWGWRRRLWARCPRLPARCCCCFPSRPR